MTILASPESSCLLLINPLLGNCDVLPNDQSEYMRTQFSVLEAASNIIGIPRYSSISDSDGKTQKWLSKPCEESNSKTFDVHFISDIAPARNTIQGKSALERLLQIGIVPISTQQLLYEWMTKSTNKSDRENLHQLIENSP